MPESTRPTSPRLPRALPVALAALAVFAATLVPVGKAEAAGPVIDCTTDPAIMSTGYDGNGGRLTSGSDPGWDWSGDLVTYADAQVVDPIPFGFWAVSPFNNASWIAHSDTGLHASRLYYFYRYQFELAPTVQPEGFSVSMDFFADNSVREIYVNTVPQSPHLDSIPQSDVDPHLYGGFLPDAGASATLDRDWQAGQNEIIVFVDSFQYYAGLLAQTTSEAFCSDFGDAPASYGTAKADGGASHLLVGFDGDTGSLMLGDAVDTEADGLGFTGLGDDVDGAADEDGVTSFDPISELSTGYSLDVAVTNDTGAAATLAGWIDFNGDGVFADDERTTAPIAAGATTSALEWSGIAPVAGSTYARLRVMPGDVADPSPVGQVSGGEVEDYPVEIASGELQYLKVADAATAAEGDIVEYTITVTNSSAAPTEGVSFVDDLADVLDDATYVDGSAAADTGAVSVAGSELTWSGDLGAQQTATITYRVRVTSTPGGDRALLNTVVDSSRPDAGASNCPSGSDDPACQATVLVDAAVDFGDAPNGYGTRAASDGASHALVDFDGASSRAPLGLGATVDPEPDALADDDANGISDEDSVASLPRLREDAEDYSLTVDVRVIGAEPATLAGWIDLDRDGVFEESERSVVALEPSATDAELTWSDIDPAPGSSWIRLRLFPGDVTDPSPTGAVVGGEVEDHPITIEALALQSGSLAFTGAALPWLGGAAAAGFLALGAVLLLRRRTA